MIPIGHTASGASFTVRVHPRARKDAVTGTLGNALKVSLTTPPVDGRANQALIEFLAEVLSVPRSSITIAAGQKGRLKVVAVAGLSPENLGQRLNQILTPDS